MPELQVLVATMHQTDLSLWEKMNIGCDAILANQADREEVTCRQTEQGTVKMITTTTRGVGLNRNIALLASEAEYLLFADEDVVYYDGAAREVCEAFRENPRADVLIFGMDMVKDGRVVERRHLKGGRLHVWNALRFGTYRIAVRRAAILRENILFHQCFGGGCPFSSGEDSLFLKTCFDRGLRVYAHETVLGTCAKDSSTWFTGYNEKYFYDRGVLMRLLFPKMPRLMAVYFAVRFKRQTQVPLLRRVRLQLDGVKGGKTMRPYRELP